MNEAAKEIAVLRKTIEHVTKQLVMGKVEKEQILNTFSSMDNVLGNLQRKLVKSNADLEKAREEAERANELKSSFLALVSHEFRTPMNGILGVSELLVSSELSTEQKQSIGVIRKSAALLLSMINNLLDTSKIEAGQMELEEEDVHLHDVIQHAVQLLDSQIQLNGNRLSITTDPNLSKNLRGDSNRIMQVLLNLLNNANKFTTNGEVNINVAVVEDQPDSQRVRVEVQDSGMGIDPEDLESLFQPYRQTKEGSSSQYGGTGLGLWICKSFVELMAGHIGVTSEKGQGSVFWFELLLPKSSEAVLSAQAAQGTDRETEADMLKGYDHSMPILIAEDNQVNRQVVHMQLRHLGLTRINFAEDGEAAVEACKQRVYGCILMDNQMPKLDGIGATAAIRKREQTEGIARVPIISLTGSVSEADKERGRDAGIDDYLTKPVTIRALAEKLQVWLPQSEEEPLIDEEVIRDILMLEDEGSTALLATLVDMYTYDTPEKIQRLRELVVSRDHMAAAEVAHELKSGSLSIGIRRLSTSFANIEQLAREGRVEEADDLTSALPRMYEVTCMELRSFL